jgi:hypothetical protein
VKRAPEGVSVHLHTLVTNRALIYTQGHRTRRVQPPPVRRGIVRRRKRTMPQEERILRQFKKEKGRKRVRSTSTEAYIYFEAGKKSHEGWRLEKQARDYAEKIFNDYREESMLKTLLEENPRPKNKFLQANNLDDLPG